MIIYIHNYRKIVRMNSKIALLYIYKYLKKWKQSITYERAVKKKLLKLYIIYKKMVQHENAVKKKQKKKFWVRPIFTLERRFLQGASDNLIPEMLNYNDMKYYNLLRVTPMLFEKLLEIVGPKIEKQYAIREPIAPRTRLEATLRYLASGDSMASVSYLFRIGHTTISNIISDTCQCIWDALKEKVFLNPTADNWRKVAKDFNDIWNYPNCIGAIDGKHVDIDVNIILFLYYKIYKMFEILIITLYKIYVYVYMY